MTQSLHIIFKDGTENWGPIYFKDKLITTSGELFKVLLESDQNQLVNLKDSTWNYKLSQIEKFKDVDLNSL